MTSSLGTARLSNDLLHVLNLGLATAESTELDEQVSKCMLVDFVVASAETTDYITWGWLP